MTPGFIAATTFLLVTGCGALAQIAKLRQREREWKDGTIGQEEIYAGLHPLREIWSLTAFLLFALSGLTRSEVDPYLIGSRTPVILLTTIIIALLARHAAPRAERYLVYAVGGNALLWCGFCAVGAGVDLANSPLRLLIDWTLGIVSFILFYAKLDQARLMLRERKSAAVAWAREIGFMVKDLSGLWYAVTVGGSLFFIGFTHTLSLLSAAAICFAKLRLERLR